MQITGTIITLNEADNIVGCIRSLERVCDELIVVDSLSEDETASLAAEAGARVIKQAYLGDGPQKAHAVPYASHDWIFSLDADERLDDDAVELAKSLPLDDARWAYAFRRKNYVGNHWVRAAGFYPDSVIRLYNRTQAEYLPKQEHAAIKAPRVRYTKAHIQHFTYSDLTDWMRRINELSSHDAWAKRNRGMKPSAARPAVHSLVALFRKLILKGGLLQGVDGMTVAVTTAFHVYMKYAKLNEMYEKNTVETPK